MTNRTLPAVAALVAAGGGAVLGAAVAERWRTSSIAPPSGESVPEPPVTDRPEYEATECDGDVPASEMTYGTSASRPRTRHC